MRDGVSTQNDTVTPFGRTWSQPVPVSSRWTLRRHSQRAGSWNASRSEAQWRTWECMHDARPMNATRVGVPPDRTVLDELSEVTSLAAASKCVSRLSA
eukprot:70157-Pleurochrysis_carterae.AAC.5